MYTDKDNASAKYIFFQQQHCIYWTITRLNSCMCYSPAPPSSSHMCVYTQTINPITFCDFVLHNLKAGCTIIRTHKKKWLKISCTMHVRLHTQKHSHTRRDHPIMKATLLFCVNISHLHLAAIMLLFYTSAHTKRQKKHVYSYRK